MHPPQLCIVPRRMSRISDGAMRTTLTSLIVIAALSGAGCEELDGRNSNRTGNRLFREMQFIDAAGAYEKALKTVDEPIIHYNLGLAYSKMYRAGSDKPVLLGEQGDELCSLIPNVKPVPAQVCIKKVKDDDLEGRRRFTECDDKNVCASSFTCKQTTMCGIESPVLADMAATHFQAWIAKQAPDDTLKAELKTLRDRIRAADEAHVARLAKLTDETAKQAEIQRHKTASEETGKRVEELTLKDDTRKLMSSVWIDTNQYDKATKFWENELAGRPNDVAIMGNLGGIALKGGDWRKSIEWYRKVGEAATEPEAKVAAYQNIGNVAWSKLNSKTLSPEDSVELADFGVAALQQAATIQPKNQRLVGLQSSITNFRSLQHGASFGAAIERASAQDLQRLSRVLAEEAKKQTQGGAPATPAPPAPPATPATPAPAAPAPTTPTPAPAPAGG